MREQVHTEGIDLGWLTPIAWVAIALLGAAAHAHAEVGYGFDTIRMQSITMVACFAAIVAMTGTCQRLHHLRNSGRRGMAALVVGAIAAVSLLTVGLGVLSFTAGR